MAAGADDLRPYLKALVLLELERQQQLQEIETKPEVLLNRAGIGMPEIAEMLGKKYTAVAKAINRAKGGSAKEKVLRALTASDEEE